LQLRALRFASVPLGQNVSGHSAAALAAALLMHGFFAVLLLNARSTPPRFTVAPIDVVLVFEPADPDPVTPDISPVLAPELVVEAVEQVREDLPLGPPADSEAPENVVSPQPQKEPVSARSPSASAVADVDANEDAYILSPATQSVLRGLQCPGDPDAFARTGVCPQGAGRHTQMVAADESASDFYKIDVAAIRAFFGQAPHALAGQSTLEDGTQRRSLSNAHGIRDVLPSSSPDPAFGD